MSRSMEQINKPRNKPDYMKMNYTIKVVAQIPREIRAWSTVGTGPIIYSSGEKVKLDSQLAPFIHRK